MTLQQYCLLFELVKLEFKLTLIPIQFNLNGPLLTWLQFYTWNGKVSRVHKRCSTWPLLSSFFSREQAQQSSIGPVCHANNFSGLGGNGKLLLTNLELTSLHSCISSFSSGLKVSLETAKNHSRKKGNSASETNSNAIIQMKHLSQTQQIDHFSIWTQFVQAKH